jgi:hypothetical protein
MPIDFKKIDYEKNLNSRQQEAYNFQKVSGVLADFGYVTIRLSNDWNGADFILQAPDGKTFYKVQLKGRLTFDKKYEDKDLYICFRDGVHGPWYIYNHADLLKKVSDSGQIVGTKSWIEKKQYHFPILSDDMKNLLKPYLIPKIDSIL